MTINAAVRFGPGEPQPGEPITFRLERLPLSLNFWTRKFWSVRADEAINTKQECLLAIGLKVRQWVAINGPWFRAPVKIELVYHVGSHKKLRTKSFRRASGIDTDNLLPKHIIDALKGVLIEDDNMHCVPRVENETVPFEGVGGFTVVTVTPYSRAR